MKARADRAVTVAGFTLIEIVIVMAILGLFATIIYSSFFTTMRAVKATEEMRDSFQPARIILQRIQNDLKGAIHRPNDDRYIFRGIQAVDGDVNHDRLDFVTCSNPISWSEKAQSDLAEVSYYISTHHYGKGYLVRRCDTHIDDEPEKGGKVEIVGENVTGLNFKYFIVGRKQSERGEELVWQELMEENTWWDLIQDPDNWFDDWDWEKYPYMPILVRVEITIADENGDESSFATTVYLNRDQQTVDAANTETGEEEEDDTTSIYENTNTGGGTTGGGGRRERRPDRVREDGGTRGNTGGTTRPR